MPKGEAPAFRHAARSAKAAPTERRSVQLLAVHDMEQFEICVVEGVADVRRPLPHVPARERRFEAQRLEGLERVATRRRVLGLDENEQMIEFQCHRRPQCRNLVGTTANNLILFVHAQQHLVVGLARGDHREAVGKVDHAAVEQHRTVDADTSPRWHRRALRDSSSGCQPRRKPRRDARNPVARRWWNG